MKKINFTLNVFLWFVVSLLAGCATADRPLMSSFFPVTTDPGQKTFKFTARTASIAYPLNTPHGEAVRMDWLAEWLRLNNYCQTGYEITERKVVAVREDSFNVYYSGKCVDKGAKEPGSK